MAKMQAEYQAVVRKHCTVAATMAGDCHATLNVKTRTPARPQRPCSKATKRGLRSSHCLYLYNGTPAQDTQNAHSGTRVCVPSTWTLQPSLLPVSQHAGTTANATSTYMRKHYFTSIFPFRIAGLLHNGSLVCRGSRHWERGSMIRTQTLRAAHGGV